MSINKLKKEITISNITRDPYYEEEYLFKKDQLTLSDQVTVIVGPNGYGKTTLVTMLKEALEKDGAMSFSNNAYARGLARAFELAVEDKYKRDNASIGFISYDSHADDHTNSISASLVNNNMQQLLLRRESSEGENNLISLADLFDNAQAVANENPDLEHLIIFVDGIDSGLSVDKIDFIVRNLDLKIKQVESQNPDLNVALVFTANHYEMVRNLPTIDPITFETINYSDYEEFRSDMIKKANH